MDLGCSITAELLHHKGAEAVRSHLQYKDDTLTVSAVPDLASSNMMFLQQPIRVQATEGQVNTASKSREKETRRAAREQTEISTFFKSRRTSREEDGEIAHRETSSAGMSGEQSTSRTVCTPLGCSLSRKLTEQRLGSTGKGPWSEETCVTWSDTQISHMATAASRRLRNIGQLETSPIPDSIRRSIEKTGIFKGTGIESSMAVNQTRLLDERNGINRIPSDSSNRSHSLTPNESTTMSNLLSGSDGQHVRPLNNRQSPRVLKSQGDSLTREFSHRKHTELPCDKERLPEGNSPVQYKQAVLERSATNIGQQQGSIRCSSPPVEVPCTRVPHEAKSPPMTREQLARKARIKPQSATLPVTKGVEKGIQCNESQSRVISPKNPDYQNHVGQPKEHDTTAPTESIMAPSIAIGNAEIGHERRVDQVQQVASQENPISIRSSPTVYAVEPAAKYLAPETLDNGCPITDSSSTRGYASQIHASHTTAHPLTNFPLPETSINWTRNHVSGPSYLSPITEDPQLAVYEYQPMYSHEAQQVFYEADYIGEHYGNRVKHEKNEVIPCADRTEYDLWDQEHTAVALPSDICIYDGPDDGRRWQEEQNGVYSTIHELWEEQAQLQPQKPGDSELWIEEGHARTDLQNVEDILLGSNSNPPYWDVREDTRYNQANDEDENILRNFWRPHRTY